MKILLVNPFDKLPGETFRDQRYTILYRLLKAGHQVRWISSDYHHWSHSRRNSNLLPPDDRQNIILIPVPHYRRNLGLKRPASHLVFSLRALNWLKSSGFEPELIVCVAPVEAMYLFARYGRKNGIPVVLDVLDLWPDLFVKAFPKTFRGMGRAFLAPYYLMSCRALAISDRITSVSRSYTEWAMARGGRDDRQSATYYYLGGVRPKGEYNFGKSREILTCLFAGQLGFNYDLETVIGAARRLRDRRVEFLIAGEGYKSGKLKKMATGLGNVKFLGWLGFEDLQDLARSCHLGLNAYTREATQSVPTKLFDYMSMGLLVVNSLEGEAAEILENRGIGESYAAGDPDSLAAVISQLSCDMPRVVERGALARAALEREFLAEDICRRMIEWLADVRKTGAP